MGKSGDRRDDSDVHVISIVWFVMIGDIQSRGNFPSVSRHPAPYSSGEWLVTSGEWQDKEPG